MDGLTLSVDPHRTGAPETGILVRAQLDGRTGSYDIAHLDAASLLKWLRSRGGSNIWAENTVGLLLNHEEPLVPSEELPPRLEPTDIV